MTAPCGRGDFIDALFPFAERPNLPAPTRHIVYVQDVVRLAKGRMVALVLLTTTSPLMIRAIPEGLSITIPESNSRAMGMRRGFVIDIHRLALLPLDEKWFPDIKSSRFVVAKADQHLMNAITRRYADMIERSPSPAVILGPKP